MGAYRAEGAGMQFMRVDPALTSRTCNVCGVVWKAETAEEGWRQLPDE